MRRSLTLLVLAALLITSSAAVTRYTLRRGDTLGGVARRLGVSVDALARANNIKNPDKIQAGRSLVVPPKGSAMKPAVASTPAPAAKPSVITSALAPIVDAHKIAGGLPPTYVVQKGDTVRVIANRYKVTVTSMVQANPGLNVDRIEIGQVLHVPSAPVWICPVNGPHTWRDDWGAFRSDTGFHEG